MNGLLGTETNVRILRALATSDNVLVSKAALARRAALNASGVGRSIDDLTDRGIVESSGAGSRRLYGLRRQHPLAGPLRDLFAAEQAVFESIIAALRAAAHRLKPPPRAAWIQGPVATESDGPGDPVIVGVLASARSVDQTAEQLRAGVAEVERAYDVMITVQGLTSADIAALPEPGREALEQTMPLLGPPPLELRAGGSPDRAENRGRSHADLDRRALLLAQALAARLSEDPSLIERARRHIARRLRQISPRERQDYEEWDRILRTMPVARLERFLVEPSERATRLRQSLPFVGALSRSDRDALMEHVGDQG